MLGADQLGADAGGELGLARVVDGGREQRAEVDLGAGAIGCGGAFGDAAQVALDVGPEGTEAFVDPLSPLYVAGLEKIRDELDKVFTEIAGGDIRWARRKAELEAGGRWVELLY